MPRPGRQRPSPVPLPAGDYKETAPYAAMEIEILTWK